MVKLMRKYQQNLMLLVTVLVIISFVYLFNGQRGADRTASDRAGSVYGVNVRTGEYSREARKFNLCQPLRLVELFSTLVGREARTEDEAIESFVWNIFVLRHEADALGIQASDDEVLAIIQKVPDFQTSGAYDSSKFNNFIRNIGGPNGLGGDDVEALIRDEIRLGKLKTLVGSTVGAVPSEVRDIFERRNQKTEASFVRLKLEDFTKAVQITDEDLKKLYEERKDNLKSDELRKVKYVAFTLEKTEPPLKGKDRVAQMSKLADRAQDFALAMVEKGANFDEVAKKFEVPVKETAEFSMQTPPPELAQAQELGSNVFEKITNEQPNSEVITSENGYYVLQLAGVTPARPLAFEEAKADLTKQLTDERSQEALNLKAAELRGKLETELKAGKSFADAATAVGVKVETLAPFSAVEPPKGDDPDTRMLTGEAFELGAGELSSPIPTGTGVVLLHVDKRLPADEQKFDQEKTMLSQAIARNKRESAFALWFKDRRALAKVATGRG
ncbi:MAG: hypothetical protein JWL90_720 [Chthoniobacteraceae bacterium]|nr:hypothetical protein [Chthoniobacteraceae bacterium]